MDLGNFARRIAHLRKMRKWTQKRLAAVLEVSDKTVGKWESALGFPDIESLPELSKIFGVSIDFLLSSDELSDFAVYEAMEEYCAKTGKETEDSGGNDGLIDDYASMIRATGIIPPLLYEKYEVKRGLRDINGDGVVAGLTDISTICGKKRIDGALVPCHGELRYRGYDIKDLVNNCDNKLARGFEEIVYLLLFGDMPRREDANIFFDDLADRRRLPKNFVRDVIMKAPSPDTMNTIAKSLLSLASYDSFANDVSLENVLSQSLNIISIFPMFAVYGYQAFLYFDQKQSLFIHYPKKEYSTAENILYMLRPDGAFTASEARMLDVMLILHAEHGGGNNSTFTTHVVTSSGTDTYSAITASLCSLKGFRHGGANLKVVHMFDDIKKHVKNWDDDKELSDYIARILEGKAFDKSGLVYGMGHAVYSLSDPRADILKDAARGLAEEKGLTHEFALYENVERLAVGLIESKRRIYKGVSANVDFYSGFVYAMLGIPEELLTPVFAIARVAGWCAHRIEELINNGKIIRPSYKSVSKERICKRKY